MDKVDSPLALTLTETVLIDTLAMGFQLVFYKEDLELSIKTHCIIYHLLCVTYIYATELYIVLHCQLFYCHYEVIA